MIATSFTPASSHVVIAENVKLTLPLAGESGSQARRGLLLEHHGLSRRRENKGRTTSLLLWCSALLLLSIVGCSKPQPSQESQQAGSAKPQKARSVCLIASGDTHGWIMPCGCTSNQSGGLLRRGTFVAQRRTNADVIVVDVGGAADGTAPYQRERFRAILKGEAAMQVAAHNLGAAEANFGVAELRQLHSETKVPLLSANAKGVRKPLPVKRHILVSAGTPTQRVLLTGVLSPEFATEEIDVSEPADAVLSVLESVTEDYDRLVVLAYLPVDDLRQLAKTLPEADVIIGGPTGQALSPENIGRTTILSATNKGKFLAEVSFTADQPVAEARVVEMSPKFEDHAAQTDNLTAFRKLLAKRDFTAAESGLVDPHMLAQTTDQKIVGTDSCKKCHDQTSAHWETTGHAHAWQRLVKEEGHVDPYCQQCHTTGYGLPGGFSSLMTSAARHDVGCESCHGPSSAHVADSSRRTPFDAAGICLKCHDPENSPHFEFDSYWEKVRHE